MRWLRTFRRRRICACAGRASAWPMNMVWLIPTFEFCGEPGTSNKLSGHRARRANQQPGRLETLDRYELAGWITWNNKLPGLIVSGDEDRAIRVTDHQTIARSS